MTTTRVTTDTLQIRFTRREKIAGLVRDIDLPLDIVRDARVVPDGLAATRGLRAPGLGLPGLRMIGTWRRPGHKTVVSVRRDRPAVQIVVDHPPVRRPAARRRRAGGARGRHPRPLTDGATADTR
ncbi:hypothetical protein [Georgenia sp. SUBG003]|uniref:hypothetical protein n=1 Tax=Georgenia sp. SUBG003 TaxID=1497974 RepID=UPI000AB1151D